MTIKRFTYRLLTTLLACLNVAILDSCRDDEAATGTGRIVFGNIDVSTVVEDITTRATDFSLPSVTSDMFTIEIIDANNDVVNSGTIESFADGIELPVATYTVKAYYGNSEEAISESPYFEGSEVVTVTANATEPVAISAKPVSAVVMPDIPESSHISEAQCIITSGSESVEIANGEWRYILPSHQYTITFVGKNQYGLSFSNEVHSNWSPVAGKLYNMNLKLTLELPQQQGGTEDGVWARRMYFNPIKTTINGVLSNLPGVKYQLYLDEAWVDATETDGEYLITGLTPSTEYRVRAVLDDLISDEQTVTTEAETDVPNGDMESDWEKTQLKLIYGVGKYLYRYSYPGWETRNEKTTDGANNANSSSNVITLWRYDNNTEPATDTEKGNVVELSTRAFYNSSVSWSGWNRTSIVNKVKSNHNIYSAYFFLGSYDASNDKCNLGISHNSRPSKLSFDIKYIPYNDDNYVITAAVYDNNKDIIASIGDASGGNSTWQTMEINFNYTNRTTKASYIHIFFQSGINDDVSYTLEQGSKNSTPYSYDKFIGSRLYIDNVELIYE